jgi:hypothetical protein
MDLEEVRNIAEELAGQANLQLSKSPQSDWLIANKRCCDVLLKLANMNAASPALVASLRLDYERDARRCKAMESLRFTDCLDFLEDPRKGKKIGRRVQPEGADYARLPLWQQIAAPVLILLEMFLMRLEFPGHGRASELPEPLGFRLVMGFGAIVVILGIFMWRGASLVATRRSAGLCLRCGHHLHDTPDRCPQCGTIPSYKPTND